MKLGTCQTSSSRSICSFWAAAAAVVAMAWVVQGMPTNPVTTTFREVQPDGTIIQLQLHGNPHDDVYMTDNEQYTVVKDPRTNGFVYAEEDGLGNLRPSSHHVLSSLHLDNKQPSHDAHENEKLHPIQHSQHPPPSPVVSSTGRNQTKRLRPTKRDCLNKICGEHHREKDNRHHQRGLRGGYGDNTRNNSTTSRSTHYEDQNSVPSRRRTLAAATERGRLRNLVLLLRWSDHTDRVLPTREDYDVLMNHKGPHSKKIAPTGSVRDVFMQNSYGTLNVESYVTDWITMDNTEEYYSNGDKGMTTKIQDAIRYALKYVDQPPREDNDDDGATTIFTTNNNNNDDDDGTQQQSVHIDYDYFDEDNDGYIDAITFIHSGYPAEAGGTDADDTFYEDRIWSHQWSLYDEPFQSTKGRGTRVGPYHISSGLWGLRGSNIGRIGVVAHEMAHFLGLPDLYDYDDTSYGVGNYCAMANSWGSNGRQLHIPYMSAWSKVVLGWVTPVEPEPGINIIDAAAIQNPEHPQVYIIKEGFPEGEFLLIENRQPIGFDKLLPQGGLAIWHIDYGLHGSYYMPHVFYSQSNEGHPLQEGWPENGNHYAVALLQADGLYDLERNFNLGDWSDLFHADDINELVPCKDQNACQYPNTDTYQEGNIHRTNVHVTDISASGTTMTFNYAVREFVSTESPSLSPTTNPTFTPSTSPSYSPTTNKERQGRKIGRFCRTHRQCTSGFCEKRRRRFFGNRYKWFGTCTFPRFYKNY